MRLCFKRENHTSYETIEDVCSFDVVWKDAKGRPRKLQFNQDDDNRDIINMEGNDQICLSALEGDWFLIRLMGP